MRIGVLLGLLAGALWGLVFIAPRLLTAFSPWELTVGRYLAYGLFAVLALAPRWRSTLAGVGRADLLAMLRQSLAGNVVYYLLLAYGVQLAGVAPTSLIVGVLPISVTLMGRRDHGAVPLRELAWPLLTVLAGIACIQVDLFSHAAAADTPLADKLLGVLCAAGALACWTWYAVDNTRYLKRHARFTSAQWSALYGLASGLMSLLVAGLGLWWFGDRLTGAAGAASGRDWTLFWSVNAVLALGASMIGNNLWNAASRRVPVTLSGQFIVFETLFALLYGFVYDGQWPRPLEWAAMLLLVTGVLWSVRKHAVQEPAH